VKAIEQERYMPSVYEKSPGDRGPESSWRGVIFVTVVIAAVVAGYFWLAR
jgi:hypothetical protein